MTDTTPRSGLPLLAAAQAQKHVTHNEALVQLDALLYARILDRDLTAPPASPADGDAYLVKAGATGLWTGQNGKLAAALDGAWRFYPPFTGLSLYVADEQKLIVFDGSAWLDYAAILTLQNVPLIGINTTADTTTRLAVKSSALLFDNTGAGVQARLNKHAGGDTASLLCQTNYSGRAELGLCGDDDFHLKVSPDGSSWIQALKVTAASGAVCLPAGQLAFPATQNPSADPNTLDDYEEGTFTPSLQCSTTNPTGVAVSAASGSYTKVGNKVSFTCQLILTSKGSGGVGTCRLGGLPFAASGSAQGMSVAARFSNVALSTNYTYIVLTTSTAQTYFNMAQCGSSQPAISIDWSANMVDNASVIASGTYLA
jgi:hypothetical protein